MSYYYPSPPYNFEGLGEYDWSIDSTFKRYNDDTIREVCASRWQDLETGLYGDDVYYAHVQFMPQLSPIDVNGDGNPEFSPSSGPQNIDGYLVLESSRNLSVKFDINDRGKGNVVDENGDTLEEMSF